jgi:hypothetical protein
MSRWFCGIDLGQHADKRLIPAVNRSFMGIDGERGLLVFVKLLGAASGSAYAFSFCHDLAQCR